MLDCRMCLNMLSTGNPVDPTVCMGCASALVKCDRCGQRKYTHEVVHHEMWCTECVEEYALSCDTCGRLSDAEDTVSVNNSTYCPSCAEYYLEECVCCLQMFSRSYMYEPDGGGYVCRSCRDDHYHYCACGSCSTLLENDSDESFCEYHLGEGWHFCPECGEATRNGDCCEEEASSILLSYSYKPRWKYHMGKSEFRVGIELEMEFGDCGNLRQFVDTVDLETDRHLIKYDGSLSSAGGELVTHPHSIELYSEEWFDNLIRDADKCGGYSTNDTGLHIHTRRKLWSTLSLYKAMRLIQTAPDYEYRDWAGRSPNYYCPRGTKGEAYDFAKYKEREKYCALALSRKTLEFRCFQSEVSAEWVRDCISKTHKMWSFVSSYGLKDMTWNNLMEVTA